MEIKADLVTINDETTQDTYPMAVYRYGHPLNEPLICVHGLTRNGLDFKFLAEALSDRYYVLCPDIPGRGKSPWFGSPALYSNGFYTTLIAQWLKQENLNSIRFLGTSMGGIIGMLLAAKKPKLISAFVMNDIGTYVSAHNLEYLKEYVGVNTESQSYDKLAEDVRKNIEGFDIKDPIILDHFIRSSIEESPTGGYRLAYDPTIRLPLAELATQDIDLSELWNLIKCPTLVIRGENSPFLPKLLADKMQSDRNNCHVVTIPGAAHAPHLSSPEQITIIRDWLLTH